MVEGWPAVADSGGRLIDRHYFCSEGCGTFALVLAQRLLDAGQRAVVTVASREGGERWSESFEAEVTHVLVRTADGYCDVHGRAASVEEAMKRAGLAGPEDRLRQADYGAAQFETLFMGDDDKPLYAPDDETRDWAHRIIEATPERFGAPAARSL